MNLREKMTAYKKKFESRVPEEALETMHRATEALKASGILEHAIKPGDSAPDFALKKTDGEEVTLRSLLKKGPVVLGFYRGQW